MVSGSLGELQLKLRGWGADQSVVEMSQSGELSMTMPLSVLSLAIDGLKPATKYEAAISTLAQETKSMPAELSFETEPQAAAVGLAPETHETRAPSKFCTTSWTHRGLIAGHLRVTLVVPRTVRLQPVWV